jgi:uncharacterized protein YndB with AHSA1/START domain
MNDENMLTFTRLVNTPPSQVYYAFSSPVGLREWLADHVDADVRPGGRVYLWWRSGYYTAGKFLTLEPEKKVVFTWMGEGDPAPTRVKVVLEAKDSGTLVTIKHKELGTGEGWETTIKNITRGWQTGLDNLQAVCETGLDPRYYKQPLIGVLPAGELDEYLAKKLGVPVSEGIVLSGVVKGMGAEAAGLQKDDVLYSLDGKVLNYENTRDIIGNYTAGDQVEVGFYRGGEKRGVTMTLSGHPAPSVPPAPVGLAEAVKAMYHKLDTKLDALLQGVTEAEADYKPAPEEWSVKEVLAHLLASERYTQEWVGSLLIGKEIGVYSVTQDERLRAMLKAYGTLAAIRAGLRCAQAETVALLELLPAELAARKSTYIRVGDGVLDTTAYHLQNHLEQIQAALEAARAA